MTYTPETLKLGMKSFFQGDLGITEGWNEDMWLIENALSCSVLQDLAIPPIPPADTFPVYRVAATGGWGEWAGKPGQIAIWDGIKWLFIVPWPGFRWIDMSHNSGNPTVMYVQILPAQVPSATYPTGDPGTKKSWTIA